jgi:hypothetical protein
MRIAVCLSGAERLESEAFTHFTRNLPADAEADCFCFFWEGGPLSDEAQLTELITRKSEGRYRHVEVQVGRNFAMDLNLQAMTYPETNVENVVRMYRGIRRCNDMKLRAEIAAQRRYDHVIRTRADVLLASPLQLGKFMPLTREFIVFPENGHWRGGLNDQFAFGASEKMDIYSLVIDYVPEHVGAGCPFHPETLLRFHLTRMGILPILAPITAQLVRS